MLHMLLCEHRPSADKPMVKHIFVGNSLDSLRHDLTGYRMTDRDGFFIHVERWLDEVANRKCTPP